MTTEHMDRQLVGIAQRRIPRVPQHPVSEQYHRELGKVSVFPEGFGQDFGDEVKTEYDNLVKEALQQGVSSNEIREARDELLQRAAKGATAWQEVDLTDINQRQAFGLALLGLENLAVGLEPFRSQAETTEDGSRMAMTSPDMMGPYERQLYYARIIGQVKESLGLAGFLGEGEPEDETDRMVWRENGQEELLRLMGDIVAINPQEMSSLLTLVQQNFSEFKGRFSDEMLVVLDTFSGGKEGGTYPGLLGLEDISKMTVEDYGKLLSMLKPNELFFLINLPFWVEHEIDGPKVGGSDEPVMGRTSITIAEVFEFLMSSEGRKNYRMKPYESAKFGISEFINWLEKKYPKAEEGLEITSGLSVANTRRETVDDPKWKKAGVLDRGQAGVEGFAPEDVYVRMGENSTWLTMFKAARALGNILPNRGVLYRGGAVFNLGPEWQKSANAYPHYLESYKQYDAWVRLRFPRFRSYAEYLMGNDPFAWFFEQSGEPVDVAAPFAPRKEMVAGKDKPHLVSTEGVVDEKYPKGSEKVLNKEQQQDRFKGQLHLLALFFEPEEDPANTIFEEAVQDVVANATGVGFDNIGKEIRGRQLVGDELVDYAWKKRREYLNSLIDQSSLEDKGLETLTEYRTFYPGDPEAMLLRMERVPQDIQEVLRRWNFEGLIRRLGGEVVDASDPGYKKDEYRGVEGAKKVAQLLREKTVWVAMPNWGGAAANSTEKHSGYEAYMLEIYNQILVMAVGATQAKEEEVMERASLSLGRGRQDMAERAVEKIDKIVQNLQGVQANPELRGASLKEYFQAYAEAVMKSGFMSNKRGFWWLYRYGHVRAEYMAGGATSLPYVNASRPSVKLVSGEIVHNPVLPGQALETYKGLYNKDVNNQRLNFQDGTLRQALAILGCYVDNGEIVYPARAAALHPISMKTEDGLLRVDVRKVDVAAAFGHMRQLPETFEKTVGFIRDGLWEVLRDVLLTPEKERKYFDPSHGGG